MTDGADDRQAAQLVNLAGARQFDELESAWMVTVEDQAFDVDAVLAVLQAVAEQEAAKPLESLLWMLLSTWTEEGRAAEALAVVRRAADLLPASDVLRDEISNLYTDARRY